MNAEILLMFVGLLGLGWSAFLFTHKRGNRKANKFLSILVVVLSFFILRRIAEYKTSTFFTFIYFLSQAFIFLIGPSIYLYMRSILETKTTSNMWKHFIPWFLTSIMMVILFLNIDEIIVIENIQLLKTASILFISLQVVHVLVYVFFSRNFIHRLEKSLSKQKSSLLRIYLKWTKHFMIVVLILGGLIVGLHLLIISGGYYEINNSADFLFLVMVSLIVLNIIYKSWKQPEIISGMYIEKEKYKNSKLSEVDKNSLSLKLQNLLTKDQVFLTHELSLRELASKMNITPHALSQLINEQYQQSFFSLVNYYRVDFAKEMIKNGKMANTTLEGIAYESGFNSRSAFNRAFKKQMSCSPKQYSESLKEK